MADMTNNPTPAQEPVTPPAQQTTPPAQESPKSFTAEQVEEMKKQWQKDADEKAKQEAKKAEELAKLSETEKEKKLREDSEAKLAELQAKVADGELTEYTRKQLTDAKLPADALPFVKGTDEKTTVERVKAFGTMYTAAVQAGVEERFKAAGRRMMSTQPGGTENKPTTKEKPVRTRGVQVISSK
jgi:membrane protein involved in colicin uptake